MMAEDSIELAGDVLAGYRQNAAGFDELIDSDGKLRSHWRPFIREWQDIGPADRAARVEKLDRLVGEFGMAHDLFADPQHRIEAWKVDLMPLLVSSADWAWLEHALIQRARLFDAIIGNIYGSQSLLRTGLIPPILLYSDPNFLRPCMGIAPHKNYLRFYAADIARGADGNWRVLDNHGETLAGSGYALANRLIHAHVGRDLFDAARALRLAPYFQALQQELLRQVEDEDSLIAMLTPGPLHDDFFGQAYLARYLGLILAEGGDLRVLGERVYMKTLEGLRPVSLIVRAVQAADADPLELGQSRSLGPVGLVHAARANPNLVLNPLGTAIIENRGLAGYLSALCEHLLSEPLELWDAPRWWLGDPAARDEVVKHWDDFILRPAQEGTARPGAARPGQALAALSGQEREALIEEIAADGARMVAEKRLDLATAPVWAPEGLKPAPYALRVFVAASEDGYHVMPGGIAMRINTPATASLSSPEGLSRDVWVQTEGPVPTTPSLLPRSVEVQRVQRVGRGLRSRIADNLFWLGRYVERADWTLRLLRTAVSRLEDGILGAQDHKIVGEALCVVLTKGQTRPDIPNGKVPSAAALEQLVRALAFSSTHPYGLRPTLSALHHLSSLIRDRLSLEVWRTLQRFAPHTGWFRDPSMPNLSFMEDLFDAGLSTLAAFNGLVAENMTRDHGWRFLDMGRRIERAGNLAELLFGLFATPRAGSDEAGALLYTLEAADSIITFRSRYLFAPTLPLVLDLLLIDEINPRGMAFQLTTVSEHLQALPQASEGALQTEEERLVLDLRTKVRLADVKALAQADTEGRRTDFARLMNDIIKGCPLVSEAVTSRYFNLKEDEQRRVRQYPGQPE